MYFMRTSKVSVPPGALYRRLSIGDMSDCRIDCRISITAARCTSYSAVEQVSLISHPLTCARCQSSSWCSEARGRRYGRDCDHVRSACGETLTGRSHCRGPAEHACLTRGGMRDVPCPYRPHRMAGSLAHLAALLHCRHLLAAAVFAGRCPAHRRSKRAQRRV